MKVITGRLLLVLASLFVAGQAGAESSRVLVVYKNKQVFQSAKVQSKTNGYLSLSGFSFGLSANTPVAKVESVLENLNTVVAQVPDEKSLEALRQDPSVALVDREVFHPAPKPFKGGIHLTDESGGTVSASAITGFRTPWGINAVKASEAWANSNAGAGARVLILDTGIDKDHPSLKPNIENTKDFVNDNNQPYDVADHVGHGSHVAGTIAGVFDKATGFTGVAPKAKILMGRVCNTQGCSNIAIAQGINWGIQQKVDVVSMSLGGAWSTPAERDAVAKADAAGITVVAAAGNDGTSKVSFPAALPTVIAVGAVDPNLKRADFSQYGPELAIVAPGVEVLSSVPLGTGRESQVIMTINGTRTQVRSTSFEGAQDMPNAVEKELVFAGLGKPEDFASVDVKGKFALVQRGEIKFLDKVNNAIKAGATGIVVYNNQPGLLRGALTQDGSTLPIGVYMVEQNIGEQAKAALSTGTKVSASLATVATDYSQFDGTSMATPHVAGVVALIKATNSKLTPKQVKDVLQSTATALGPNDKNEYGAGLVNAQMAVSKAKSMTTQN